MPQLFSTCGTLAPVGVPGIRVQDGLTLDVFAKKNDGRFGTCVLKKVLTPVMPTPRGVSSFSDDSGNLPLLVWSYSSIAIASLVPACVASGLAFR